MSAITLMAGIMSMSQHLPMAEVSVSVHALTEDERNEVLAFLAERPLHTVCIAGLIRDNGIVSPHNRGTFYGCRNSEGRLEGVALIGHHTLVEARTRRAIQEFALVAHVHPRIHLILGESEMVEQFWNDYADEGQEMRLACRELLFDVRQAVAIQGDECKLRLAAPEDLELLVPVHAAMAEAESGVNPLSVDPDGFRQRYLRRIEMNRVWVLIEDGRLLFKAEIQADTPDVVYLEGVWVCPQERGTGRGRQWFTQLCRDLLVRTNSVCVLVNEVDERAQKFYRMCNFKLRSVYDTLFMKRDL